MQQEILSKLNDQRFKEDLTAALSGSVDPCVSMLVKATPLEAFLLVNFAGLSSGRYNYSSFGWEQRSMAQKAANIYMTKDRTIETIINQIPKELLKEILPSKGYTKAREMQLSANFNENSKELSLNQFSLAIFKKHLESHKKLSGKDVIRYLDNLPTPSEESEVIAQEGYRKLLLDNAKTKSKALVDRLINSANVDSYLKREERAIDMVRTVRDLASDTDKSISKHIHFSEHFFFLAARSLGVSLRISGLNLPANCLHKYVTGIAKPSTMSNYDVIYAIDKLVILSALATKSHHPYYDIAIDQLVEELDNNRSDKSTATLEAFTESYQDMQTATTYTNELLKTILKGNNQ